MKEPRIKMTENEQIAANVLGLDSNYTSVNMGEHSIDNMIQREKANKFNNEVEKYNAQLEENQKTFEETGSQRKYYCRCWWLYSPC